MAMAASFSLPVAFPSLPRRINCTLCYVINSRAKIPMPPINRRDPFLSRLASVAETSPAKLINRSVNSDMPPYLDLYDPPTLMATPAFPSCYNASRKLDSSPSFGKEKSCIVSGMQGSCIHRPK